MKIENSIFLGACVVGIVWLSVIGLFAWALIKFVLHFT